MGGWHQDFARQNLQGGEQSISQIPGQGASSYRFSTMSTMPMASHFEGGFAVPQAEQSSMMQQSEIFNEEAFARAFEEASRSELDLGQESSQRLDAELGHDITINESTQHMAESDHLMEQERLGADLIHDPSRTDQQDRQQQDDPDALARTAAQLLDSVRNNQSDKFQNSQFLHLMRQLRDREVMVEGDKIVGANGDEIQLTKVESP